MKNVTLLVLASLYGFSAQAKYSEIIGRCYNKDENSMSRELSFQSENISGKKAILVERYFNGFVSVYGVETTNPTGLKDQNLKLLADDGSEIIVTYHNPEVFSGKVNFKGQVYVCHGALD